MKIKKTIRMTNEISMASTSDIAFLLIIFFMVTSSFALKEGLHLVLPAADKKPEIVKDKDITDIVVIAHDDVKLGGKRIAIEGIEKELKEIIEKKDDTIVLIKIHKDVRYKDAVKIIDAVKYAGAKKLSLRMLE